MTSAARFLGKTLTIRIDRQMGTRHPEHGFIYPVNYGFLPGVISPDGEEMDAYLLGVFEAATEFTGVCIAVIHRLDDDDDKLVIAPRGKFYTPDQIRSLTEFQERYFVSEILT